jgi:hypothetical protein
MLLKDYLITSGEDYSIVNYSKIVSRTQELVLAGLIQLTSKVVTEIMTG